jgi:hypothetical protein
VVLIKPGRGAGNDNIPISIINRLILSNLVAAQFESHEVQPSPIGKRFCALGSAVLFFPIQGGLG